MFSYCNMKKKIYNAIESYLILKIEKIYTKLFYQVMSLILVNYGILLIVYYY